MIISACLRSSGKTTITIGLLCLFKEMGFDVQAFKKGPDFIDPMWLSASSGKPCYNLDLFMMGGENVLISFKKRPADIVIIEGNMGLYDSMDIEGKDSTASLSRILKTPVVLVVDAGRMNRGIAPLILGYQRFEDVEIAGVILNKIASLRHEEKLKKSLRNYCPIEVLGAIPIKDEIVIKESRHGLVPINANVEGIIPRISKVVKDYVDIERIISITKLPYKYQTTPRKEGKKQKGIKLAIAKDPAFCFYYPDNIEALEENGADITFFSPLEEGSLPPCDALYLGGGFPELFIKRLRENNIAKEICMLIEEGMPVYAECGGLVYLILIGAIKGELKIHKKPIGHGYVFLKARDENKWFRRKYIKGHEFHYSEIRNIKDVDFGYDVIYGKGINGKKDGVIYKNVLASYTHLHCLSLQNWGGSLLKYIIQKTKNLTFRKT